MTKKIKKIEDCIKFETNHIICREEEGKKICFKNTMFPIVCGVVPIDKGVFNKVKGEKGCDYLFLFDKNKQEYNIMNNKSLSYYVELKGVDLIHACKQISNSIEKTKEQIPNFEINALIVSSREFTPQYDNNEYYRNVRRLIHKKIQFEISPYTVSL